MIISFLLIGILSQKFADTCPSQCLRAGIDFTGEPTLNTIIRPEVPPDARLPNWEPGKYIPDVHICGNFSQEYCAKYKEAFPDRECLIGLIPGHAISIIVINDERGFPWMCAKEPQTPSDKAPDCIKLDLHNPGRYPHYVIPEDFRKMVCMHYHNPADCELSLTPFQIPFDPYDITQPMYQCGIHDRNACPATQMHKTRSCWMESRGEGYTTATQTCTCRMLPFYCQWETLGE